MHASLPLFHGSNALDELARLDLRGLRTWTTPSPDEQWSSRSIEGDVEDSSGLWQLWLGSGGVMSALHYDQTHNVFVQLHGAPTLTRRHHEDHLVNVSIYWRRSFAVTPICSDELICECVT